MKRIFFLIVVSVLAFYVIAHNTENILVDKYCAKLKDGITIVMADGIKLTSDVTLENGTTIRTDGTILKTDGTKIVLQDEECVDKDGKMIDSRFNQK